MDRSFSLGALRVVVASEWLGNIPVLGGGGAVLFDRARAIRGVRSSLLEELPSGHPTFPRLAALDQVRRQFTFEGELDDRHLTLAILREGTKGRWVYAIRPTPSIVLRSAPVYLLDATHGAIVQVLELARDARLRVYPTNPVASPTLEEVMAKDLVSASPQHLLGTRVDARNCPDRQELIPVNVMGFMLNVHTCSEVAVDEADPNGDFLHDPGAAADPGDLFAEAHMYHHVSRVYEFFKGLGFADVNSLPLRSVVNFRVPVDLQSGNLDLQNLTNPNGTLYPFDNAFFLPGAGEILPGVNRNFDSLVFGQGSNVDFSYDGDVIYHEFGHAVIGATSRLDGVDIDAEGLDPSTGALNEAYADFFSAVLSGDSRVGEFVGTGLGVGSEIRDLTNMERCPEVLWGEVHQDSLPWSAALWQIYQELGSDSVKPILAALMMLPRDADFADAAMLTVEAIRAALGDGAAQSAQENFDTRGLSDCSRVLEATSRPTLFGAGTSETGLAPYAPGAVQFRFDLQAPSAGIVVTMDVEGGVTSLVPGAAGPMPLLLAKRGQAIQFTHQGTQISSDAEASVGFVSTGGIRMHAEWKTMLDAGSYYVTIANAGGGAVYRNLVIDTLAVVIPDAGIEPDAAAPDGGVRDSGGGDGATSPGDASPKADARRPRNQGLDEETSEEDPNDGCAVRAGARPSRGTFPTVLLGVFVWVRIARARRRAK